MNKINLWAILVTLSLLLTSCSTVDNEFKSMVKEINKYNENIKVPEDDLSLYIDELTEEEMLTWDEFGSFFNYTPKEFKTNKAYKNALRDDIELLFKALRTNYAPYNYFGGDKVFFKAKDEILEFIDSQEEIQHYEIVNFMVDRLSFVDDKHFNIGNTKTVYSEFMYVDMKNNYYKDDNGYYKIEDDKKYYIKSIDGNKDLEENIKYSISEDGQLIFRAFVIRENNITRGENPLLNKIKVEMIFDENKEVKEEVVFNVIGTTEYKSMPILEYEEKDNIAIVAMRAMRMNGEEEALDFVNSAINSKKSKVTILDLRDNGGGDIVMPSMWLKTRFNKIIKPNSKGLFLERILDQPEEVGALKESFIYEYCSFDPINNNYYKMQDKGTDDLVNNNKYIFVLIDKYTGSAGEYFIDLLRRIENVVIIGSNTNGALNSSRYGNFYLPNTGLAFGYGNMLRVHYDEVFEEGRGFMPDIIVNDDDALDKVMKLIEYYDLN